MRGSSGLGPDLWNIMYDAIFDLALAAEACLVGFVDDVGLLIEAKTEDELMESANDATTTVVDWLQSMSLQVTPSKTEPIIFSGKRRLRPVSFNVQGLQVFPKSQLNYFGVQLNKRLTFAAYVGKAAKKAGRMAVALERIMPNIGGPRSSKRRFLGGVIHSVVSYAAPIWSDALLRVNARSRMNLVQRRVALRTISAYRTVSDEAALMLARILPIDILVRERVRTWGAGNNNLGRARRKAERERSVIDWQARWVEGGRDSGRGD